MSTSPPAPIPNPKGWSDWREVWLMRSAYGVPLLVVIYAGWLFVRWLTAPPPTSEELRNLFHTHRNDFDQLIQTMAEDRHMDVVYNRGWLIELMSVTSPEPKRLRQCHKLLRRLHVSSITQNSDGYSLTVWTGGAFPDDGRYLGYRYYSPGHAPAREEIVQNLKISGPDTPSGYQYMSLEPPWFLYYME